MSYLLLYFMMGCNSEEGIKTFNANPSISIVSHSSGVSIQEGYEATFWAQAGDSDHSHDELFVTWYFNQEELCPEEQPDVSGQSICTARLEESGF